MLQNPPKGYAPGMFVAVGSLNLFAAMAGFWGSYNKKRVLLVFIVFGGFSTLLQVSGQDNCGGPCPETMHGAGCGWAGLRGGAEGSNWGRACAALHVTWCPHAMHADVILLTLSLPQMIFIITLHTSFDTVANAIKDNSTVRRTAFPGPTPGLGPGC